MKPKRLPHELTNKEREILNTLSTGKYYKEIGVEHNITIDTVKKHCKNIYRKLGVRNRKQAVLTLVD